MFIKRPFFLELAVLYSYVQHLQCIMQQALQSHRVKRSQICMSDGETARIDCIIVPAFSVVVFIPLSCLSYVCPGTWSICVYCLCLLYTSDAADDC